MKLTRTLLIIPISLRLAAVGGRRARAEMRAATARTAASSTDTVGEAAVPLPTVVSVRRLVPWFLVGFVLLAANSIGLIPPATHHDLARVSTFLITLALSAIGLSTDLAGFRRTGPRPLLLGALLWLAVSAASLGLQAVTGLL